MPSPQDTIQTDLKTALKAGDKERVATLRLLLSAIKNERIESGEEVDDATFARLVRKAVKQRRDSAQAYRDGGREELAAKEEREAEILADYQPEPVGEDELRSAIEEYVAAENLSGPQGIGPVMKTMTSRFGSRADGATISRIAKSVLAR